MQITREADYAIRCVYYLASHVDITSAVGEISKTQGVPKAFTAKILQKLVKAGIVKSIRGIKGGFLLNKEPLNITLLSVIEAVQGPLNLNICVIDKKNCDRSGFCSIHPVWVEIQAELEKKLKSYNFSMILDSEKMS